MTAHVMIALAKNALHIPSLAPAARQLLECSVILVAMLPCVATIRVLFNWLKAPFQKQSFTCYPTT